ncbi:CBS domain-containing protein [Dokdonella sp.]|uniref:CBS domain-containing protein n=1 Tax=Dokdonella sp. TaxID=2291710 RepID=UPI0039C8A512
MRVRDLCTSDAICVFEDVSVREAAREMRRRHVGMLVVMERTNGPRASPCADRRMRATSPRCS